MQYWGKTDNGHFPTHYVQQILNTITPWCDGDVGFNVGCEYWE